jgi:hypothetical protein
MEGNMATGAFPSRMKTNMKENGGPLIAPIYIVTFFSFIFFLTLICINRDGKKHGYGTYVWGNGSKYEGAYCDAKKEGFGFMVYNNGDTYEGLK